MATQKTVNYTETQTASMVEAYSEASTDFERSEVVSQFAEEFGKSLASIRAKLSREGVYIKKAYVSKAGKPATKKSAKVSLIAMKCNVSDDAMDSLEKSTHGVLDILLNNLS